MSALLYDLTMSAGRVLSPIFHVAIYIFAAVGFIIVVGFTNFCLRNRTETKQHCRRLFLDFVYDSARPGEKGYAGSLLVRQLNRISYQVDLFRLDEHRGDGQDGLKFLRNAQADLFVLADRLQHTPDGKFLQQDEEAEEPALAAAS
jgi:hypothetical protein